MMLPHVVKNRVMVKTCSIALIWVVCVCTSVCAQSTYLGVTLDRGKEPETNCIYIFNDNDDSVKVFIQYKIGNRYTEWIDYPVPQLIPPTILEPQKIGCIDSTIIGLNLVDVVIVKNKVITTDKQSDSGRQKEGIWDKIKSLFSKD